MSTYFFSSGFGGGTITFHWQPDPLIVAEQADIAAANVNVMTRPLRIARNLARGNIKEHFDTESGPDGEQWADWSDWDGNGMFESYESRASRTNKGILDRSGGLRGDATSDSAFNVTTREVFYTVPAPLGVWHNDGLPFRMTSNDKENPLPKREFGGIDEKTQNLIVVAFNEWFDDSIEVLTGGRRVAKKFTRNIRSSMSYFTAPEEVMDYFFDLFQTEKGQLGLASVEYGDSNLIVEYPAIVVVSDVPLLREMIHASHRFKIMFNLSFYVYHAAMTISREKRTREDLQLVTRITHRIHLDMSLGGQIIQGWINSESPGVMQRVKGAPVIGTRLTWSGESREMF